MRTFVWICLIGLLGASQASAQNPFRKRKVLNTYQITPLYEVGPSADSTIVQDSIPPSFKEELDTVPKQAGGFSQGEILPKLEEGGSASPVLPRTQSPLDPSGKEKKALNLVDSLPIPMESNPVIPPKGKEENEPSPPVAASPPIPLPTSPLLQGGKDTLVIQSIVSPIGLGMNEAQFQILLEQMANMEERLSRVSPPALRQEAPTPTQVQLESSSQTLILDRLSSLEGQVQALLQTQLQGASDEVQSADSTSLSKQDLQEIILALRQSQADMLDSIQSFSLYQQSFDSMRVPEIQGDSVLFATQSGDSSLVLSQSLQNVGTELMRINLLLQGAEKREVERRKETQELSQSVREIRSQNQRLETYLRNMQDTLTKQTERPIVSEAPPPIPTWMGVRKVRVFFDKGKTNIFELDQAELEAVITQLREHPELRIQIRGFADQTGNAAFNQRLSEMRAQSVQNYFLNRGIEAERIQVESFGDTRAAYGSALDRRVEIELVEE